MDTKVVLIYATGVILGAGTGYLVADRLLRDKEEVWEKALEDYDENHAQKEVPCGGENSVTIVPLTAETTNIDKQNGKVDKVDYASFTQKDKGNLASLTKKYRPEGEEKAESKQDPNRPFLISLEQYSTSDLRAEVLTYYEDDDTLVDANNDPITSREALLGPNALSKFGVGSGDPDTFYMQNNKLEKVFEVIRLPESYNVAIMGGVPEQKEELQKPIEKPKRASKTRKVKNIDDDDDEDES